MNGDIRSLGITGNLRRDSYKRLVLRSEQQKVPHGVALELIDLRAIPVIQNDRKECE